MDFKYVRIQGREIAWNTNYAKGIFSICMQLIDSSVMEEEDADLAKEINQWFSEILPYPPQCQNREKVVCFFKTENSDEMLKLIKPMMWLLDKYHHPFYVVYTNYPGKIVYEDEYQVVVEVEDPVITYDVHEH